MELRRVPREGVEVAEVAARLIAVESEDAVLTTRGFGEGSEIREGVRAEARKEDGRRRGVVEGGDEGEGEIVRDWEMRDFRGRGCGGGRESERERGGDCGSGSGSGRGSECGRGRGRGGERGGGVRGGRRARFRFRAGREGEGREQEEEGSPRGPPGSGDDHTWGRRFTHLGR
jgi:hypothetical protein